MIQYSKPIGTIDPGRVDVGQALLELIVIQRVSRGYIYT
jgi:hypothetical protein